MDGHWQELHASASASDVCLTRSALAAPNIPPALPSQRKYTQLRTLTGTTGMSSQNMVSAGRRHCPTKVTSCAQSPSTVQRLLAQQKVADRYVLHRRITQADTTTAISYVPNASACCCSLRHLPRCLPGIWYVLTGAGYVGVVYVLCARLQIAA
jgi:hypothetical protein